jgi:hypothetical protein
MKYTHLGTNNAKRPILGSEAKERGRKDTQNGVSTQRVMEMTLSKAGFGIVSG